MGVNRFWSSRDGGVLGFGDRWCADGSLSVSLRLVMENVVGWCGNLVHPSIGVELLELSGVRKK